MIKPLSLIAIILCGLGIALYFYEHGAEQGKENLSGQILLKQLDTKNLNKIQVRSSEGLLELHQKSASLPLERVVSLRIGASLIAGPPPSKK